MFLVIVWEIHKELDHDSTTKHLHTSRPEYYNLTSSNNLVIYWLCRVLDVIKWIIDNLKPIHDPFTKTQSVTERLYI